jgi:hypothetical protein
VFAHNYQTIRASSDFLHDDSLADIWLAKNRMQSCHHRHFEVLQKLQNMAAALPTENSIFMLQTYEIDIAGIEKISGGCVGRKVFFG